MKVPIQTGCCLKSSMIQFRRLIPAVTSRFHQLSLESRRHKRSTPFTMTTRKQEERKSASINWRTSEAKCILIEDLVSGALPLDAKDCSPKLAWEMYKDMPEFSDVPYTQFRDRLNGHRVQVRKNMSRSKHEEQCLLHDRSLFP